MLPDLLEAYREQVEREQVEERPVQLELEADLQAVARAAERLRGKLADLT